MEPARAVENTEGVAIYQRGEWDLSQFGEQATLHPPNNAFNALLRRLHQEAATENAILAWERRNVTVQTTSGSEQPPTHAEGN